MKISILIFSLFISSVAFCQIEVKTSPKKFTVGTIKRTGTELFGEVIDNDTTYVLMYRNAEYQHIIDFRSISFTNEDNTLEQFYKLLKSVFLDENVKNKEYKVEFKLGDKDVSVSNFRMMGTSQSMFVTPRGYALFNEKEIDKLFGKK